MDRPLEHLSACHRRILDRLATLERAASRLIDQPVEALQAIHGCIRFFDSNGALHTADEEESLFPRLGGGLTEQERACIEGLRSQHVQAEAAYAALKDALGALQTFSRFHVEAVARFSACVSALCGIYREHIAKEDSCFPALGARLLSEEDQAAIASEMKRRRGL
jgi:hemerythrin-like domain-containing protein